MFMFYLEDWGAGLPALPLGYAAVLEGVPIFYAINLGEPSHPAA